jgi:general L-amino acid transport system substrate-binding protein
MRIGSLGAALAAGVAVWAAAPAAAQPNGDTVAAIRNRGSLACGVSPNSPGFAEQDALGAWRGLDVDYCRALASVILGDAAKARPVAVPATRRFEILRSGEIDVLARNTSWTLERDVGHEVAFVGITYFDGLGFLAHLSKGINSVRQAEALSVCVEVATTTEQNLAEYARTLRLHWTAVAIEGADAAAAAFLARRCDVLAGDVSALAAFRAAQGSRAGSYVLLPEVISKEPLGPVIRKGDWRFFDIARWTHFAMLTAEELNITSATVEQFRESANPDIQRFFGTTGQSGRMLGLDADWGARLVRQVGHYGEAWERNIAPLGLLRGPNLLWNQGGLQYAPPMR